MGMSSNRPYLVKAYYDWIVANDCTPHLVVDTHQPGVSVPQSHVTDGQIVLNIAPRAAQNFIMDDTAVSFNTRFGGIPTDIYVPINAILGIYARENGQGMAFEPEVAPDTGQASKTPGHTLRSVDKTLSDPAKPPVERPAEPSEPEPDDTPPKPPSNPGGGHARLRVVK